MDRQEAADFGQSWGEAWNRRDVEAVLEHFAQDAVFTSPVAKRIGFAPDGVVRGKDDLRRYWTAAMEGNPDLCFTLTAVFQGVETIAIAFRNQEGVDRVEILKFQNGLVVEGHGTFVAHPLCVPRSSDRRRAAVRRPFRQGGAETIVPASLRQARLGPEPASHGRG